LETRSMRPAPAAFAAGGVRGQRYKRHRLTRRAIGIHSSLGQAGARVFVAALKVIHARSVAWDRNRVADTLTSATHFVVATANRPTDILLDRATDEVGCALGRAATNSAARNEVFFAATFASTLVLRAATIDASDVIAGATDTAIGALPRNAAGRSARTQSGAAACAARGALSTQAAAGAARGIAFQRIALVRFRVAGIADPGTVVGIAAESIACHLDARVGRCAPVATCLAARTAKIGASFSAEAELAGGAADLFAHALPVAAGVVAALGVVGGTERRLRITAGRTADGEPIRADARPVDR
jgi:hypothetical protein